MYIPNLSLSFLNLSIYLFIDLFSKHELTSENTCLWNNLGDKNR